MSASAISLTMVRNTSISPSAMSLRISCRPFIVTSTIGCLPSSSCQDSEEDDPDGRLLPSGPPALPAIASQDSSTAAGRGTLQPFAATTGLLEAKASDAGAGRDM